VTIHSGWLACPDARVLFRIARVSRTVEEASTRSHAIFGQTCSTTLEPIPREYPWLDSIDRDLASVLTLSSK